MQASKQISPARGCSLEVGLSAGGRLTCQRRPLRRFRSSESLSLCVAVTLALACNMLSQKAAVAQGESGSQTPGATTKPPSLITQQDAISIRFARFEKTLLQMAEHMRRADPERADLLIRAIGRSKQDRIDQQMQQIMLLLDRQQFGDAVGRQGEVVDNMKALLELLQSEDRRSEIEKEKQRIQDLLKGIQGLIGKEKDVRVGTERRGDADGLSDKQAQVAGQTGKLIDKVADQDAAKNAKENPQANNQQDDRQPDKDRDGAGQPKPNEKKDEGKGGEPKDSQPRDGNQSDRPQKGSPQQDGPSQGQPNQGQPNREPDESGRDSNRRNEYRTPGREDLEKARDEMEKAIQELKQRDHDKASGHQDSALQKLAEAKAKLEEILRQLREEEQKLLLVALEVRFQKMLAMQLAVYHETLRLGKVPENEFASRHANRAEQISRDEEEIGLEADKALTLLKEEGSSVAFPEAVIAMREDIYQIARWLHAAQVGPLTQELEMEVIESLQEVIEALQKEIEKNEDGQQRQQQSQQQQMDAQMKALVDQLAELKMLRALQLRINRRTKRLGRLIKGEQSSDANVTQQLQELAKRQSRVQRATHDLVTGRNK